MERHRVYVQHLRSALGCCPRAKDGQRHGVADAKVSGLERRRAAGAYHSASDKRV